LIPLHSQLREALSTWQQITDGTGPVVRSERGGAMKPLSIVLRFSNAYRELRPEGCSSHSGRRTFITRAARLV
jgi:integrase/recombinase XerD